MSASLAFDGSYLRSISGILKICCLFCSFIGCLCIACSSVPVKNVRGTLYISVAIFGLCCTTCVLVARLFQLWQRKFYNFNVAKYEAFLHALLAIIYFVASATALSLDVAAYSVATFFGLLAFSFYSYDSYLGYRLSRLSDAATQTQNV